MGSKISKKRRVLIFNKYRKRCSYCGIKIKYEEMHIDHIKPLYRGWSKSELDNLKIVKGTGKLENLNPSCASCNISKSTLTIDKWRNEIRLKIDRLRRDSTNFRLLERFGLIKEVNHNVVFHFEKIQLKNKKNG